MTVDARFWNEIADAYSRKPVENPQAFERKIAITLAQLKPRDVVLDVGCGTGSLALRLAPYAGHVHGLDVSEAMVRIARAKAGAQQIANVTFHVGTLEGCTAFEEGSLDGLCAYSLLHLVEDRDATLARIHRLLKPGGFFISSNVCLGDSWVPYRPLLRVMRLLGKAPPVWTFRRRTVEDEVRRAGFVDMTCRDVGADRTIAFMVAFKPSASRRPASSPSS
jgi:arsenite methyltransferase